MSNALGRAARAFGDTINIGVNAATGGLFNRGIGYLMGASPDQVDAINARMRANTGVGGDLASGIGQVYGFGKLMGAGRATIGAVRAAPQAAALVPTAGIGTAARFLTGRAGPGLVPVVAATAPKASTVAKAAGAAGLIGLNLAAGRDGTVTPAPAPAAAPERPVEAALAAGRTLPAEITPYERQLAALNAIFKSPNATLSDLQSATGMLPARPKPPTAKDNVLSETAALSQAIFQNDIKNAEELAKTDPEGARALTAKAMEAEFQRRAGLVGLNPMNIAQAQLMAPAEEE